MPSAPGDLQPVGGDALGVLAGVGVARLDGVGERAHRGRVGAAQLLGARALLLEGLAQVGGVALELAAGAPSRSWRPARRAALDRRSSAPAAPRSSAGVALSLQSSSDEPTGRRRAAALQERPARRRPRRRPAIGSASSRARPGASSPSEKTTTERRSRRPRRSSRGERGLGVGQAGVDERDLEAARRSHSAPRPRRRRGPLVARSPRSSQRRRRPRCAASGRPTTSTRTRPARIAAPSASASSSASIGLLTDPLAATAPRGRRTPTRRRPAGRRRRGSARSARRTSKPLMPRHAGCRASSRRSCSARSRSSAVGAVVDDLARRRRTARAARRSAARRPARRRPRARGGRAAPRAARSPARGRARAAGGRSNVVPSPGVGGDVDRAAVQVDERAHDRRARGRCPASPSRRRRGRSARRRARSASGVMPRPVSATSISTRLAGRAARDGDAAALRRCRGARW